MAKIERTVYGDFDDILHDIEDGIINSSISASLESSSDYETDGARCSIRVFERYSMIGSNRLSLTVVLFQNSDEIEICGISSGGSNALFMKINTFGEEAFLEVFENILNRI